MYCTGVLASGSPALPSLDEELDASQVMVDIALEANVSIFLYVISLHINQPSSFYIVPLPNCHSDRCHNCHVDKTVTSLYSWISTHASASFWWQVREENGEF